MPIVIDADTERLVRRLADATDATLDEAVRDAVSARLIHVTPTPPRAKKRSFEEFLAAIKRIQAEVAEMPVLDPRSPEDMLYDEFGLPK